MFLTYFPADYLEVLTVSHTIAIAHIIPEEKIAQVQVTEILNVQKNHDRFHPSRSALRRTSSF